MSNKVITLKKNLEFGRVFSKGKWAGSKYLVIYYKINRAKFNKIGISVNKKVRNSVKRNRARRIIKEVYRLNCDKIKKGYDIVIYCKDSEVNFKYKDIEKDFIYILKKEELIIKE